MTTRLRHSEPIYPASAIQPGYTFDTLFEQGCKVATTVEPFTNSFNGWDCEGVLCSYSLVMVEAVWDETGEPVGL